MRATIRLKKERHDYFMVKHYAIMNNYNMQELEEEYFLYR
jgi:hypothetical protein